MHIVPSIIETESNTVLAHLEAGDIRHFCQRWQITELALFGSAIREDFTPDSDVDILVTFAPKANWGLLDHIQMEQELADLIGRAVDLVTKRSVEQSQNRLLKKEILNSSQVIFQQ